MTTAPPQVEAPPPRSDPRPHPWLVLVSAIALLLFGAGLWWFWPDEPSPQGDPGRAAIGEAPQATGSVGTAGLDSQVLSAPSAAPQLRQAALVVRTESPTTGPLGYALRVTISNPGDTAGSWHSVALRLSGANLTVTLAKAAVAYELRAPVHCLIATSPVTLAAGESITLELTVTALQPDRLGGVESARLDEAPCPV